MMYSNSKDSNNNSTSEIMTAVGAECEVEAKCLAELPAEIRVPVPIEGYKGRSIFPSGIYHLGFEIKSDKELSITYYMTHINKKMIVFSLIIERNIEKVQTEVQELLNYMKKNGVQIYNTGRFVKICADYLRGTNGCNMDVDRIGLSNDTKSITNE